jgi:capsule polysaccharide export protein KpsE/RkpR
MLQDLRAIIVNNKLYKPKQQSSWYTRLICEREKEAVTINGKLNGAEILKNLIENDAKIKQMVFSHKNPLTKKMVTYFKSEVKIITGKDVKITKADMSTGLPTQVIEIIKFIMKQKYLVIRWLNYFLK